MNIKYLKKFRKRFSWRFVDSKYYPVILLDNKRKVLIDCDNVTHAVNIMIHGVLGHSMLISRIDRKESSERLAKYNAEFKLQKNKNIGPYLLEY